MDRHFRATKSRAATNNKPTDVPIKSVLSPGKRAKLAARDIETAKTRLTMANAVESANFRLEVFDSAVKGKAVRTCDPISRFDFVCEYAGELVSGEEAEVREARYGSEPGCYMYFFEHARRTLCVDATVDRGNDGVGRLINHSKRNGNLETVKVTVDKVPRLAFFAREDIQPGTELSYDYGDRDEENMAAFPWLAQ